jgi:hypothetical protein
LIIVTAIKLIGGGTASVFSFLTDPKLSHPGSAWGLFKKKRSQADPGWDSLSTLFVNRSCPSKDRLGNSDPGWDSLGPLFFNRCIKLFHPGSAWERFEEKHSQADPEWTSLFLCFEEDAPSCPTPDQLSNSLRRSVPKLIRGGIAWVPWFLKDASRVFSSKETDKEKPSSCPTRDQLEDSQIKSLQAGPEWDSLKEGKC